MKAFLCIFEHYCPVTFTTLNFIVNSFEIFIIAVININRVVISRSPGLAIFPFIRCRQDRLSPLLCDQFQNSIFQKILYRNLQSCFPHFLQSF